MIYHLKFNKPFKKKNCIFKLVCLISVLKLKDIQFKVIENKGRQLSLNKIR